MSQSENDPVPGGVESQDTVNRKKFKIKKNGSSERDAVITVVEGSGYTAEKLKVDKLPKTTQDGKGITWFTNFAIKKDGTAINQRYTVTIERLSASRVVVCYGDNVVHDYGPVGSDDTITLTNGDPAIGGAP